MLADRPPRGLHEQEEKAGRAGPEAEREAAAAAAAVDVAVRVGRAEMEHRQMVAKEYGDGKMMMQYGRLQERHAQLETQLAQVTCLCPRHC